MPIYRLFRDSAIEPEALKMLADAFDDVCRELGLAERTDPLRDIVARTVLILAQLGERDPARLRELTLERFGKNKPSVPAISPRAGAPSGPTPT